MLCTVTTTLKLAEIPCCFPLRLKNQLNDISNNSFCIYVAPPLVTTTALNKPIHQDSSLATEQKWDIWPCNNTLYANLRSFLVNWAYIAPSRLGLFLNWKNSVYVLTSLCAMESGRMYRKIDKFHPCCLSCLLFQNIQAWYISIDYIRFLFMAKLFILLLPKLYTPR